MANPSHDSPVQVFIMKIHLVRSSEVVVTSFISQLEELGLASTASKFAVGVGYWFNEHGKWYVCKEVVHLVTNGGAVGEPRTFVHLCRKVEGDHDSLFVIIDSRYGQWAPSASSTRSGQQTTEQLYEIKSYLAAGRCGESQDFRLLVPWNEQQPKQLKRAKRSLFSGSCLEGSQNYTETIALRYPYRCGDS